MAKVDRAVALGVWTVATNPAAPSWNEKSPKTEGFRAKRK
jgi:hypothetical protein